MALYESVFLVRQDVTAAQVDSLADNFAKIVEDKGGKIDRREYWGLRSLSYRIKKNRKAHYVLFNLDAPSEAVREMERNMQINEDVLRYLTIRLEQSRSEPSPIMQGKGDRERERADRGDRRGGRGRPYRGGPDGERGDDRGPNQPAAAPERTPAVATAAEDADSPNTTEKED